jgi:hypothetical protein
MAATFYDVSNPQLRVLHRGYIRQCLDAFADTSNVIQMTSAEYSGPLEFAQFWLDTIIEWQQETGRDVLVALSAPKDVQDAILADPERAKHIDVIDIRYWAYTADDGLYAPKGGQNLAPRQHLRQTRLKPGGAAAIVKAIQECRDRYPDKAVIYNAEENCPSAHDGWATLIAGGSLADVKLPEELAAIISTLQPSDAVARGDGSWCLTNDSGEDVFYSATKSNAMDLKLPIGRYAARWLDVSTGDVLSSTEINADGRVHLTLESPVLWLTRHK